MTDKKNWPRNSEYIREFPGEFHPDMCKDIIQFHEENCELKPQTYGGEVDEDLRKCVGCYGHYQFERYIEMALHRCVSIYYNMLDQPVPMNQLGFTGYNFVRYDAGGHLCWHNDTTQSTSKQISIIVYLNDDFEGGETQFDFTGDEEPDMCIKPETGKVALWLSRDFIHRGAPVTKGSKYILVCWLERYIQDTVGYMHVHR